jgi:transposase InsO family protein
MSIITAGTKHPPTDRYQVWLKGRIRGITGNYVDISGWFTLFDLKGAYDLIVGKNWHSKTRHLVDSNNVLHLLDADWTLLTDGRPAYVPKLALTGLRPHQGRYREVHNHCAMVAHTASINLISAEETIRTMKARHSGDRIFVIDIRERTLRDEFGEDESTLADLGKWRAQIRQDFNDLFQLPKGVPPPGEHDFRILTDPTGKIPHRQPYRMTLAEREEFEVQIKKLLANGWVTDSHSRYAAPVIFVKKADGTLRMCVDYRGLNKITIKDRYPLPYIDDLLDKLHGGRVFTKLDLASGYHQVRIHPDDCHKTAFIAPDGFYEYKVIPFGLANAPAAFMRMMHQLLRQHRRYAIVYLDDVLIFSKTVAEHKVHVEGVLQSVRRARLRLSESKCVFGAQETTFVGFKVNRYGIHTEEKKVKAVREWPTPQSPSALRSFLGLAGYYRKFVSKFAHRAHLLHDLAAKPKDEYIWSDGHRAQFEDLKQALTSAPVLATLDPDTDFILRTDASDTAIGGVLAQKQLFEGKVVERPLGYFSRKLHSVETRYPAYDRELLAISANLEHWACYVHGRKHTTIYTDHAALQHILGQTKLSSRQWRHLDKLQQHDYDVKYFPGAGNIVADALSRIAYTQQAEPTSELLNIVELHISASKEWLDDVRVAYGEDLIFGPVLDHLRMDDTDNQATCTGNTKKYRRTRERAKSYLLQDGLLYHKPSGGKLCIPKSLQADVIREAHDAILGGGHVGVEKTAAAVAARYHWPSMTDSIAAWVAGCDICHRVKHKNTRQYGLLQALPTPLERAERVNIDFITKLPTSEDGYDAVATVIDPLTKRARWIPVTEGSLTAERFATAFIAGYVRSRGLPVSIVSDRDTRFTSNFWQSLCSQLGIKLRMSTAYHPQSDGQAEKANASLETFLKAYITQLEHPRKWDRLLPLAEFTYNAAKHKAIGMSPFEADIGYIPRLPLDLLAPGPRTPDSHTAIAYAEHLAKTLRMLRERMEETQLSMVSEANEHRQQHPFMVGDEVFLDTRLLPIGYANVTGTANNTSNSRKFQHPYAGPFNLLKKAGENAFVLDIPAHWRLHPVFNVARLKPSKVDKTRGHPPPPPLRSSATSNPEYEVEAILEHKGTTIRDLKYLLKWVGDPDPTWEPLANLRGSSNQLLRDYHSANGLRTYQWMSAV